MEMVPRAVLGRYEATVCSFSLVFQGHTALCAQLQTSLSVVAELCRICLCLSRASAVALCVSCRIAVPPSNHQQKRMVGSSSDLTRVHGSSPHATVEQQVWGEGLQRSWQGLRSYSIPNHASLLWPLKKQMTVSISQESFGKTQGDSVLLNRSVSSSAGARQHCWGGAEMLVFRRLRLVLQ